RPTREARGELPRGRSAQSEHVGGQGVEESRVDYITFLLLGLGAGAVYAALGLNLVITYRSSRGVNFATGAMATYSAYVYANLRNGGGYFVPIPGLPPLIDLGGPMAFWPALAITLVTSALLGLVIYLAVFRPLRNALPLAKVVASLGVMIILQALI